MKKQFDYYYDLHKMPYRDIDPSRLALGLIKSGTNVLSCGCGAGREVSFLKSINCNVIAIDYSKRMIEQSKSQVEADYFVSELTRLSDLNLEENSFDYITCLFNTINNLPDSNDRKGFIYKCYSLLKPQGKLIITSTNMFSSLRTFFIRLFNIHNQKSYYYSPTEIKIWFEDTPFKIQQTKINETTLIIAEK